MKRPVLLFDIMGTLVKDPFYETIPAFFGMTGQELLRQKHPTAWIDFELGRLSEAAYYREMFGDGRKVDAQGLRRRLIEAYAWLDGAEELLVELGSAGYPMHALSNYPSWYELIETKLGVSRYVAWSFVSCRTGIRKPDQEAYRHAAKTLNTAITECVLIDDRAANCEAADRVGMPSIHFQDVPSLRRTLAERGML